MFEGISVGALNMSGQITTNTNRLQILVNRIRQPVCDAAIAQATLHLRDWLDTALAGYRQLEAAGFVAAKHV